MRPILPISPGVQNKPISGLYLPVEIYGLNVDCLIDSGSTLSVMHPRKFEALSLKERPPILKVDGNLRMADGGLISQLGYVTVPLTMSNGLTLKQQVVLADVEAPVILGFDFLQNHNCVLDAAQGTLSVDGEMLTCTPENKMSLVFRVALAETVIVPPESEMILPGNIQGNPCYTCAVIEPNSSFVSKHKDILVGRTLVDSNVERVPLRVVNLSTKPVQLYQNTSLANCQPSKAISEVEAKKVCEGKMQSDELPEYLQVLWSSCAENLTMEQQTLVKVLLQKNQKIFASSKDDLGQTGIVQHRIHTREALPCRQPPRRLPLSKKEAATEEVKRLLRQGIVEPSVSPWASPVVLVEKKDGSYRLCVDYRKLNAVTIKDSYPLPRIDDSIDALRGSKWFSTLDLASGFWQVQVDPRDVEKTAFVTSSGLYQFKVLPFGLVNAPATFERLMERILAGLQWEICLVYLDDIIVFADSFEEYMQRLSQVLERIKTAGLKINPKKCHFLQMEVDFLVHRVMVLL